MFPEGFANPSFLPSGQQVGCTEEGLLNGVEMTVYTDCGYCPNEDSLYLVVDHVDNGRGN